MPDSLITKKALASSLKELMETQPLTKISVGDICEKCGMNRKSFYYHFCDKYELVNWIFDTEFNEIRNRPGHIADFEEICEYFYSDREFYRNALRMTGQNSFRDYFRTQIHPVIRELIGNLLDSEDDTEFLATFIADGTVSALIRWLNEPARRDGAQSQTHHGGDIKSLYREKRGRESRGKRSNIKTARPRSALIRPQTAAAACRVAAVYCVVKSESRGGVPASAANLNI